MSALLQLSAGNADVEKLGAEPVSRYVFCEWQAKRTTGRFAPHILPEYITADGGHPLPLESNWR